METAEQLTAIRGWRLTAAREAVGLDSVKKLAAYLALYAADRGDPPPRGFSARTLNDVEAGKNTLSPQAADYIAAALGLSRSFFTAPAGHLGDVTAGEQAIAAAVSRTPLALLGATPVEGLAGAVGDALDQFDELLDRQADGGSPDPQSGDGQAQPQTGTRP